jgi:hypothetical protein
MQSVYLSLNLLTLATDLSVGNDDLESIWRTVHFEFSAGLFGGKVLIFANFI